jgi:ABC-type uncharacterized transport system substrate-binding protein
MIAMRQAVVGAALAALASLAAASLAWAHPHVWVTVRSKVAFAPDGKLGAARRPPLSLRAHGHVPALS